MPHLHELADEITLGVIAVCAGVFALELIFPGGINGTPATQLPGTVPTLPPGGNNPPPPPPPPNAPTAWLSCSPLTGDSSTTYYQNIKFSNLPFGAVVKSTLTNAGGFSNGMNNVGTLDGSGMFFFAPFTGAALGMGTWQTQAFIHDAKTDALLATTNQITITVTS